MTRLASKSVPQPTKRGLRPERQTNMSALPYVADDRVASCRTRTGHSGMRRLRRSGIPISRSAGSRSSKNNNVANVGRRADRERRERYAMCTHLS
jgi:hypothetical protein